MFSGIYQGDNTCRSLAALERSAALHSIWKAYSYSVALRKILIASPWPLSVLSFPFYSKNLLATTCRLIGP